MASVSSGVMPMIFHELSYPSRPSLARQPNSDHPANMFMPLKVTRTT